MIGNVRNAETYGFLVPRYVDDMDQAARAAGRWSGLGLAYLRLIHDAKGRGRNDMVTLFTDRLVAIVREHPEFQRPPGNTNAIQPPHLALLLLELNREADLRRLINDAANGPKADLLVGAVDARITRNEVAEARRLIAEELRPLDPDAAGRLLGMLDGQIVPLPAPKRPDPRTRFPRETDPFELRLRLSFKTIAEYHAKQGNIALATEQLTAIDESRVLYPPGRYTLPSYMRAQLGVLAHQGGHDAAAREAFEQALQVVAREPGGDDGKTQYIRDAVALGDYKLASSFLRFGGALDGDQRRKLGRLYVAAGQTARAVALWEEGLANVGGSEGNSNMAILAGEFYRIGQVQRGEQLLTDSARNMMDIAFGSATASAVVQTTIRINRLDLLERIYTQSSPRDRMLLCMAAGTLGALMQNGAPLPK